MLPLPSYGPGGLSPSEGWGVFAVYPSESTTLMGWGPIHNRKCMSMIFLTREKERGHRNRLGRRTDVR